MSQRTTATRKNPLLPAGTATFFRRRAVEAVGIVLCVASAFILVAFATYNADDPSFNLATEAPATNLLGWPGSYTADVLLQTLGLAGLVLAFVLMAWAWRAFSHTGPRWPWLNVTLLPVALVLSTAFFAAVPAPDSWPIRMGLGGYVGDWVYSNISALLPYDPSTQWIYRLVTAATALAAIVFTLGLYGHEWRALAGGAGRTALSLWRAIAGLGKAGQAFDTVRGALRERTGALRGKKIVDRVPRPVEPDPVDEPDAFEPMAPAAGPAKDSPRVVKRKSKTAVGKRADAERQPSLNLSPHGEHQLPPLRLLALQPDSDAGEVISEDALEQNARLLESVLDDFGVRGEIVKVRPGPVVTLYELEPAPGTKSSRVVGLADDIARSMSAVSARVAVIPGRNAIGIELPNNRRETVYLRELLATADYEKTGSSLTLALGKDIGGTPVFADLARMPHLLIAGTTGSGKSVAINTMILSLLYRLSPEQCRFIMIDPKMLELSVYDGIPHLLAPVVTEPGKAIVALKWAVREMEDRYRKMSELGVRNIAGYNRRLEEARDKGDTLSRTVQTGFDTETGEPVFEERTLDLDPLPLIVVIVDEMADLMMVAGKDVEAAIQRLSQMARAAGIHLIMATQRPSVDVITGTIKSNFPTRISFQVTSKIDSRTILGEQGAEQLLGAGDMLYMAGAGRVTRVHGPFVSDEEVESIVAFLKKQGKPDYNDQVTEESEGDTFSFPGMPGGGGGSDHDALYDQAVALVCRERKASTSFVQRHLQIGYNRAARIIEQMETEGVIGPANHVGKREVLARDIDDRAS